MELNKDQELGLKIAIERFKNREPYTVISGSAGVGKSFLVRYIIEALNISEDDVVFTAYTGKAAQVLQKRGNKNAMTLHKLLYESKPLGDGTFINTPVSEINYELVVVDEVSMAPKKMMDQLLSYGVHVICLGDESQLPPVEPSQDNHLLDNPHIFLKEIMRQEADSEIIKVSADIREGKKLAPFSGNEVKIIKKSNLTTGMLLWADQIICSKNSTRNAINNNVRRLLGREESVEPGDKIICLRNYWEKMSEQKNALINGTIGYLDAFYPESIFIPKFYNGGKIQKINTIVANIKTDSGDTIKGLRLDKDMILTGNKTLDSKMEFRISRTKYAWMIPYDFIYAYAITAWKSQGSEWDKVLVFEEDFPYDKETHKQALYTAVTRASKKLVLVLKD